MWLVAKIKNNNSNEIFKNEVLKIDKKIQFYEPKYKINYIIQNKTIEIKKNLFNTYIFCKLFDYDRNSLNKFKYCKGLNYFLTGCEFHQENIFKFINYCKSFEDEEKMITNNFFKNLINVKGKFVSGPFKSIIFELIEKKKNKTLVSFGNFVAAIGDNKAIYVPA